MKKEIKTIQEYWNLLKRYLENFFESQRTKLICGIGYNFYGFLIKTKYRIKGLGVSLKKIIETTDNKKIIKYLKKKDKKLQKKVFKRKEKSCNSKKYLKIFIDHILWCHGGNLFELMEEKESLNFKEIEDVLLESLTDQVFEYSSIIDSTTKKKYGEFVYPEKVYKEKAITQRLKKGNKVKK